MKRLAVAGLLLSLFFVGMRGAWDAGASRLLSAYSSEVNAVGHAREAVGQNPSDPEASYVLAALHAASGSWSEAIAEYERAVRLRPDDYVLWLELGRARDLNGNTKGALDATARAVALAPYYTEPRWQLGNIHFRAGDYEKAFSELRLAAGSDPTRWPVVVDLAWQLTNGDVAAVREMVRPDSDEARLAFAVQLKKHGEVSEAVAVLRDSSSFPKHERRAWVSELIANGQLAEAYDLWASPGESGPGSVALRPGTVSNPGFEEVIRLQGDGFGWQPGRELQDLRLTRDMSIASEGRYCLLVEYAGDSKPASPVVSQMVWVEPGSRYRLRFSARTMRIVSGGLPRVFVAGAGRKEGEVLAQSVELPADSGEWRSYSLNFETGHETKAIRIVLSRKPCSSGPCPAFGNLWLDAFELEKLQTESQSGPR